MNIKVAIADDHQIFTRGIETILTYFDELSLVLKASNGADLLNKLENTQPDVILLDLKMPVMDGFAALSVLKSNFPGIKVIVLTLIEDEVAKSRVIKMGAYAFISKTSDPACIVRTIKESYAC